MFTTCFLSFKLPASLIEYVRVFKSLFVTEGTDLYTYIIRISADPSYLQADAAFIIEIDRTSKVTEMFKNDYCEKRAWAKVNSTVQLHYKL